MLRRPCTRALQAFGRRQINTRSGAKHFPNGAAYKAYRVRFKNPPIFTLKGVTKFLAYSVPVWFIWTHFVPLVIDVEIDDDAAETVGEDGSADIERNNNRLNDDGFEEMDEDATFIPVGWPTQQPRTFYKGSDPEWQEFLRLAKDPQRNRDVQVRLVSAIRDEIANHPHAGHIFGQIDRKKGKWWIDTIYPEGPPQEYLVSGIEITDDYIAWSKKEMSQQEYHKLTRTILPMAAIWSSWASARYLLEVQLNRVREMFGLAPKWNDQVERLQKAIRMKETASGGLGDKTTGQSSAATSRSADPPRPVDSSRDSVGGKDADPSSSASTEQKNVGLPKLPAITPSTEKRNPMTLMLFMSTMASQQKPISVEPPRGSVIFTGMIEVVGTNGRTTVDVTAAYDPKANEFIVWRWQPRRIQPRTQRPKGGR